MERRSLSDDPPMNADVARIDGKAGPSSLARRPDFTLGAATIRPSIRTVEGPAGARIAEPRVMQVLLVLADARGAVLTRTDLLETCWNGQVVGDDAVNRAIAEARRIARETEAGFTIETIPRIGYRLAVEAALADAASHAIADGEGAPAERLSRRAVLAGGGIAIAAGGGGLWAWRRARNDARTAELVEEGKRALLVGTAESNDEAVASLREAVALTPRNAAAWGWLSAALRRVLEDGGARDQAATANGAEQAARRALEIDPADANARATMIILRTHLDGWAATERRVEEVLKSAPDNVPTLEYLAFFLQGVGRCRDSRIFNDRVAALVPLAPNCQHRRALKHWIFGENDAADRVINQARQIWPEHPLVWNSRLIIYAFTDRAKAALAMLDDEPARPAEMRPASIATWRHLLGALESRAPADIAAATKAGVEAATRGPYLAASAIMALSALGQTDAAFNIANGFLLGRGPLVPERVAGARRHALFSDPGWRRTQWLFTPATAPMRADPRFRALAADIGLVKYWRERGAGPDAFVRGVI